MKKVIAAASLIIISLIGRAQDSLGVVFLTNEEYLKQSFFAPTQKMLNEKLPISKFLDAPPVGNQGRQGSCVGWSVGYTALSTVWHPSGTPWNADNELSPSYIYNQVKIGDCNRGARVRDALNLVEKQGSCPIRLMPYNERDCDLQPNQEQKDEAYKYRIIHGWAAINPKDIDLFKIRINHKCPVIIAFEVTEAFDDMWNNKAGIWDSNYGTSRGGHCVAIIGYDDSKQMFKAQNQWGDAKGEHGYFWITYNMIQNGCLREAYTFLD